MKKLNLLVIALLMATVNCFAGDVKTIVLQISQETAMHCENCAKRAEKALTADKGVKEVQVNLEEQTVTVKYDVAETNESKLIEDLKAGRFEASVAGKKCANCEKNGGDCCEGEKKQGEHKHAAAKEHKHGEHQHGGDCCEGEKK